MSEKPRFIVIAPFEISQEKLDEAADGQGVEMHVRPDLCPDNRTGYLIDNSYLRPQTMLDKISDEVVRSIRWQKESS